MSNPLQCFCIHLTCYQRMQSSQFSAGTLGEETSAERVAVSRVFAGVTQFCLLCV